MTAKERFYIAEEIVRRIDTVTLLKVEEVRELHAKAQAGEFDDFWETDRAYKARQIKGTEKAG